MKFTKEWWDTEYTLAKDEGALRKICEEIEALDYIDENIGR